ncbi:VWA domain-containing protein [Roseiconus nitratireducens]|uniref:VWA domain-containing protein n=1 Tax=Roseiconus nitratireducens TaxID=2605748 RepID=A0A5M6D4H6_9BACT|nr:VWA domain-containing protein [Roseiconus nitratireducens]KAA5542243.1 VWA domain-containing protein [Roseiconus nitratireducens]
MLPYRLSFEHPTYLWLLLGLPVLWFLGYQSLAVLGKTRRALALLLRSLVWTVLVFALAGVQVVRVSDRMTVMYVLDQSESIPLAKRQVMLDYVVRNVRRHRDARRQDRAGIIVFGRDASIEIPPFDDDIRLRRLESLLDRADATNLESALNLAQATMSADTARRIVVVTDGNENLGQARKLVARVAAAGIGIDVVPVMLDAKSEVLVEKIDLPTDIRKGQPFEARIVVSNYADNAGSDAEPTKGKIRVKQKVGDNESILLEQDITLENGKNVFPLRHTIDRPAPYIYEAEFVPAGDDDDGLRQNNSATAYTHVRGQGRVLLIEDRSNEGDFDLMVDRLRDNNIEVVTQFNDDLFGSLAELQAYDAVILAGVPRVSGDSDNKIVSFSDAQIEMLVRNTQQLGAGLLMIGGPEAFGAGGWTGTELEKAMPVDFKIKNAKVQAVGALALIMHASEMADGNHWQKVICKSAIEQLGPSDLAGVLHWSFNGDAWLWGGQQGLLEVGPNRRAMLARVSKMTPGDMPQFDPAMKMAAKSLAAAPASVKHCIIISDGDPSDPTPGTINAFKNASISISTVAVASHGLAGSQRLQNIATATGGKYYSVKSGRALPRIFQREARRVSKPLVYEPPGGAVPEVIFPHPLLDGIDRVLPPVSGFVMTQTKDSPLAQVLIQSPKPEQPENATILAAWTYGLGRTAALTTDAGARWAGAWNDWADYDKFYSQLVRWLMRPTGDTGKFTIATQVEDGQVQVVVNALAEDDSFLDFLEMNATALDAELNPIPLEMRQTAPGRYVGSFPANSAGSYFVNVVPTAGATPLTTGVTVPYSDEYRVRETNLSLIESLAKTQPRGGAAGEVTPPLEQRPGAESVDSDPFRGGLALARSIRDAWPWFVLGGCCLFLGDVMIRRIALDFSWIGRLIRRLRGEKVDQSAAVTRLDALRKSKAQLGDDLEKRRASVRFEPTRVDGSDEPVDLADPGQPRKGSLPESPKDEPAPTSYTERLLEAKRRARKDKPDGE